MLNKRKELIQYIIKKAYYLRIFNAINKEKNSVENLYKTLSTQYSQLQKKGSLTIDQLNFLIEYIQLDDDYTKQEAIDMFNSIEESMLNSDLIQTNEKNPIPHLKQDDLRKIRSYSFYKIHEDIGIGKKMDLELYLSKIGKALHNSPDGKKLAEDIYYNHELNKENVKAGKMLYEDSIKHHQEYLERKKELDNYNKKDNQKKVKNRNI